jgi:hypothetical protein
MIFTLQTIYLRECKDTKIKMFKPNWFVNILFSATNKKRNRISPVPFFICSIQTVKSNFDLYIYT